MEQSRAPRERRVAIDGGELCCFEWEGTSPDVALFVHATGFHGRVWDATIRALPVDQRAIAIDQLGHGRSSKRGPYTWDRFGAALASAIETLDLERIVGVGHSMGGHAVVQAAAAHQHRFDRLVLIDPVIMDPTFYAHGGGVAASFKPEDHPTSKRKNDWTSWREMFERFAGRGSFALWRRDVLEDYCRYGVLPNPDGPGFVLACPPLVEASIYSQSSGRDITPVFATITLPVTVLRARRREGPRGDMMDFSASPTWPELASRFPHGRDVYLPELTHFIPMQDPPLVARYVMSARGR